MNEIIVSRVSIAPSRRLVPEKTSAEYEIAEYYNPVVDARIIEIPPAMFALHSLLEKNRLAVPTTVEKSETAQKLQIPTGSQTIQQVLKSISTDTIRYAPLFEGIGTQLNRAQKAGFGFKSLSDERSLLGSIAFSPVERAEVEDLVFFLPPYALEEGGSIENSTHQINIELMNSGHFDTTKARELLYALLLGIGKD